MRTASQLRENSHGSPWYAACSLRAVMELLGRDFLDSFKVVIDPAAGTVTLVPR
jgi:hypothetical protein